MAVLDPVGIPPGSGVAVWQVTFLHFGLQAWLSHLAGRLPHNTREGANPGTESDTALDPRTEDEDMALHNPSGAEGQEMLMVNQIITFLIPQWSGDHTSSG